MFGGMEMNKKKMGGLGKLSQFSGIKSQQSEPAVAIVEDAQGAIAPSTQSAPVAVAEGTASLTADPPPSPIEAKVDSKTLETNKGEKTVTVNIKITKGQKDWLAETASFVRENNTEPVPPSERVYPQHLIGVAIELLRSADVDWSQIKNVEDLQQQLNL
jgi:hypothetical protein